MPGPPAPFLPAFGVRDALPLCRRHDADLPFIVAAGTVNEETALESLRLEVDDFVIKDRLPRWGPAVERALRETEARREHGPTRPRPSRPGRWRR